MLFWPFSALLEALGTQWIWKSVPCPAPWKHSSVSDHTAVVRTLLKTFLEIWQLPSWPIIAPYQIHNFTILPFCRIQIQTLLWMKFCQAVDSKACAHFKVKWNAFKDIPEFKVKLVFHIWPSDTDNYKYLDEQALCQVLERLRYRRHGLNPQSNVMREEKSPQTNKSQEITITT